MALVADLAWHVARDATVTAGVVAKPISVYLLSSETLERAADLMVDPAVSILPIVEPGTARLTAIVRRSDVLDAYRSLARA